MTATVTKAGPYYSSGSISFSSLRTNFKESGTGEIKASELRRNSTITNTNPIVPDATENSNISISSNLKLSQFRNSIKYYYITQSGTELNFNISSQSWNGNLTKNILKTMYINGTCGSNSTSNSASSFNSTAYNLTIDVSGAIYGCGGSGGTSATISGGSGGNALNIQSNNGNNIVVFVRGGANIYGGGGGGEKGVNGANGSSGTCTNFTSTQGCGSAPGCPGGYSEYSSSSGGCCQSTCVCWFRCCQRCVKWSQTRNCVQSYTVSGGIGGSGGDGGPGRGYNNLSGSLLGSSGANGTSNNGCGSTDGLKGENGGNGGDWGNNGGDTTNTGTGGLTGSAISGSNYSVIGTITSNTIKGRYNP